MKSTAKKSPLIALRTAGLMASAAALLVAVGACSASEPEDSEPSDWVTDTSATAEVNPDAMTIILPLDRYLLSEAEIAELLSARSLAINLCASEEGFVSEWRPVEPVAFGDRRFGVWVRESVERWGYGLPQPAEEPWANNSILEAMDVYEECNNSEDAQRFQFEAVQPGFDYGAEVAGLSDAALESDAAAVVFDEWGECIEAQGLEREESAPWGVAGTNIDVTEENIRIALIDVGCKDSTNYIQRIANIRASYEQPIVDKYLNELTDMRAEYDAMISDAEQYVLENAP